MTCRDRSATDWSARGRNGLTRTLEQFASRALALGADKRAGATERIGGVKVVRIDTSFNAGRMLKMGIRSLGLLASLGITRAIGLPPQISRHARKVFVRAVTSKIAASWVGSRDHVIRQSGFTMRFTVPPRTAARSAESPQAPIVRKLHVTHVGQPQHINPFKTVAPFAQLALAIDALGDARH